MSAITETTTRPTLTKEVTTTPSAESNSSSSSEQRTGYSIVSIVQCAVLIHLGLLRPPRMLCNARRLFVCLCCLLATLRKNY